MTDIPALEPTDAVLIVDPQNDFCPGGSLAVADAHAVIPVLNAWGAAAGQAGVPVFVSRDWHPLHTTHFQAHGGVWPVHCVQGTPGSDFHPGLELPADAVIVSKGMGEDEDAYSAFHARDEAGTPLADLLRASGARNLYVMGLATDYCVKFSVLKGIEAGFDVTVVAEGCRAVNLQPQDGAAAIDVMTAAGATLLR